MKKSISTKNFFIRFNKKRKKINFSVILTWIYIDCIDV
ncbi:hypothetical protein LEP1GSC150_2691 [Leptospira interrogans serovar Copenhageni str. LT2050]|uniref:Uncharacterized protein n=1 Tax=Leptospira interrogans serovar Copenhageni str. LT2050 TaxID=1001598 RepID=M3G8L6_LEPIT|nr:hypothetical protein LEP1GSC150_2691 [Leptospira interrogans serovar Copenhageni str. LT2050]